MYISTTSKKYGLLAAGELLADLIGCQFSPDLLTTTEFRRLAGGSPANLASNMARLGHSTALVACVGADNVGKFLMDEVAKTGVQTSFIAVDGHQPTSIVLVSRTKGTPDFIAYRQADTQLHEHHFPETLLGETAIFHTTCFALSREPARRSLLKAAQQARELGAIISIDANYAPSIWPDRTEAQRVIAEYVQGGLVKLSSDDAERIFGRTVEPQEVFTFFFAQGVQLICYTLGAEGSILAWEKGAKIQHFPVEAVEVKDATGAGDAFWAGFLSAFLNRYNPEVCARAGARMAARKISSVEPLPSTLDPAFLYA
ncbi:carbohydrate kinase family protein [Arundinibacter roseus]|uniref:Carbohydrate kinase n=1 Tax=Arundinibacter roseus TaxID=2070510 RepID=A0A4R4K9C6_9BACT|nr:carbohydrate kinase [Arundinibacter roseus]TDB64093.1 carbohydrate kinase [Arundinibacter roseus]